MHILRESRNILWWGDTNIEVQFMLTSPRVGN